ncbi:LysR family transcriptional regulator [Alcaligenaceae bacterium]|nr:LysR family transcriptional regulator [Alcaligenaceae bacterium]
MNIRQLETLVRVVEDGSFAAAAEALHVTQSTVSARIKELENYFGVDVFNRASHRAQLTPQGRELYEGAQELIERAGGLRERVGDQRAMAGLLRLGAVGHVASTWLPALLAGLRDQYPALRMRVDVGLSRTLIERVASGRLEAAIVAGELHDPSLHFEPMAQDDFVWMASAGLDIPEEACTPAGLAHWPILSYAEDSHHFPVMRKWFWDSGTSFQPAITTNNMELLARLVIAGQGLAMLPRDYFNEEITAGRLKVLQTEPALESVGFYLVYPRENSTLFGLRVVQAILDAHKLVALGSGSEPA